MPSRPAIWGIRTIRMPPVDSTDHARAPACRVAREAPNGDALDCRETGAGSRCRGRSKDAAPAGAEEPAAKPRPEKPAVVEKGDSAPVAWPGRNWRGRGRPGGALMGKRFRRFQTEPQGRPARGQRLVGLYPRWPARRRSGEKANRVAQPGVPTSSSCRKAPAGFAISLGIFSSEKGSSERL